MPAEELPEAATKMFLRKAVPEGFGHRCSSKKVFLKISKFPQESTCIGVSF